MIDLDGLINVKEVELSRYIYIVTELFAFCFCLFVGWGKILISKNY